MSALPFPNTSRCERDRLWDHARNALGIARLLAHEGRPSSLVDTACCLAEETACRAALDQAGLPFQGDAQTALASLAAPDDVIFSKATSRVARCERVLAWLADYLRSRAPERSWGF